MRISCLWSFLKSQREKKIFPVKNALAESLRNFYFISSQEKVIEKKNVTCK